MTRDTNGLLSLFRESDGISTESQFFSVQNWYDHCVSYRAVNMRVGDELLDN